MKRIPETVTKRPYKKSEQFYLRYPHLRPGYEKLESGEEPPVEVKVKVKRTSKKETVRRYWICRR